MTPCGASHALFGLVFAYVFSEIALSCCVFAASAVVRGLGSCFLSLRLFACLCCRLSFGGVAMFHVKHSFAATCLAKGRLLPRLSLRSCDAESRACCGLPEAPVLCGMSRYAREAGRMGEGR